VQHEEVDVGAEFGDHEGYALGHQPCDQMHVAQQPVELDDQHLPSMVPRRSQRRGELRATVERVGPLPRLPSVNISTTSMPFWAARMARRSR